MHVLISALHRPSKPTGVCRHAANLAQCLADTNKVTKVTLLIGIWQQDYFATVFNLDSEKIKVISVDIKNNSLTRNIWFLFGLPKLANQLTPDIVHLSFPIPFVRSQFTCPVIATIHDLYPYECPENFGYLQSAFNRYFLKQCIEQSDGLSCVSQTTLEKLKFFFPKISANMAVIYNYVDFEGIKPKIPDLLKNKENLSFLLSVAQHRKNKNIDVIIQAYYLLIKEEKINDSTKLILVGSSGPETKNLYNKVQSLGLQDRVYFMSSLEDCELIWLYQNCTLFIMPSSNEGFCLPLAEALSLSCKVVCSNIPIFLEIAGSDCSYFDLKGNLVNNFKEAIIQALHQPSSVQHSETFRFSKSAISNQYLNFYDKAIH
jgi:glycosyltransferase involved in cell wall biosynthesis